MDVVQKTTFQEGMLDLITSESYFSKIQTDWEGRRIAIESIGGWKEYCQGSTFFSKDNPKLTTLIVILFIARKLD